MSENPRKVKHANAYVLDAVTMALDAALSVRVRLHAERQDGRISVAEYLDGLRAVRQVEQAWEALRDAEHSRAFELSRDAMPGSGADLAAQGGALS